MASILKTLKDNIIGADTIGRKRDGSGNYLFRREYFYRHGMDSDIYADNISKQLTDIGINHAVVKSGDHWAPFRGGASTAQSSHFWVEVNINQ